MSNKVMRILALVIIGATAGTALDHLHVLGGILDYPSPFALGEALWVPPLFAGAALGLADGHASFTRALGGAAAPRSLARLAVAFGGFALAYAFTAFAPARSRAQDALVLAALVVGWIAFSRATGALRREFVLYALGTAIIGTSVELALTHLGPLRYVRPSLGSVALWLPGLYLWGAFVGRALDAQLAPARD